METTGRYAMFSPEQEAGSWCCFTTTALCHWWLFFSSFGEIKRKSTQSEWSSFLKKSLWLQYAKGVKLRKTGSLALGLLPFCYSEIWWILPLFPPNLCLLQFWRHMSGLTPPLSSKKHIYLPRMHYHFGWWPLNIFHHSLLPLLHILC